MKPAIFSVTSIATRRIEKFHCHLVVPSGIFIELTNINFLLAKADGCEILVGEFKVELIR